MGRARGGLGSHVIVRLEEGAVGFSSDCGLLDLSLVRRNTSLLA